MSDPARPETDPTVPQSGNRHGNRGHYSGQEDDASASPAIASVDAGGVIGGVPRHPGSGSGNGEDAEDLPPDAGHRATVDQRTGAVRGSGAGAGGGQDGEDFDDDTGGSNAAR